MPPSPGMYLGYHAEALAAERADGFLELPRPPAASDVDD